MGLGVARNSRAAVQGEAAALPTGVRARARIHSQRTGDFSERNLHTMTEKNSSHPRRWFLWLEDMIPWQRTELRKKIADAVDIPILTGEDIYLKENFIELCKAHAVDIIHPDLATSGGILETKKIGDAAEDLGVPMAMHFAGTPISCMANVHCAAATENFLVLENHSVDVPWWSDMVDGVEKPIVNKGFITVPDKPGLGVTLNEAVVKQHLLEPGYFEPTPQWNTDRTNDRLWS